jgi:chromosome partitioning protein
MRKIMVLNAKGGSGKTTIATNIASHFAKTKKNVVIADFDPQHSSLDWLRKRASHLPPITGLDAVNHPLRVPKETDVVIFDVQAGVYGKDLTQMVRRAETIVLPVLPSPIDIREQVRIGLIANRVKEKSWGYDKLEAFLKSLDIPIIASLRETQNYLRAQERGLGVFDMGHSLAGHDVNQWKPIIKWLNSKKSIPKAKAS